MLFVEPTSQVLVEALQASDSVDFEYCEFGGFRGKVKLDGQSLTVHLSHPSIAGLCSEGLVDHLSKTHYPFADIQLTPNQNLKFSCPASVSSTRE